MPEEKPGLHVIDGGLYDDDEYEDTMLDDALDLVESFYRRFVAYPSEQAIVAHVLWTVHCHLVPCFDTTPRLAFMSPEKASGKTRALEVTALFVPNPRLAFSMSAASLVRIISKGHEDGLIPTILFDEIDNVFARSEEGIAELRGALNSGYRRGATAVRCAAHGASVIEFPCFAPLAVAGLKTLPDTLASRAIFVRMRRRSPDECIEPFRTRIHPREAEPIRDALVQWCIRHWDDVMGFEPVMPEGLVDRDADCWEPLLAIADVAGGEWPTRARDAAKYLIGGAVVDDTVSVGVELLRDIRSVFFGDEKRIWTETLLSRLAQLPESRWKDIKGHALTDRGLADLLRPYGIHSKDVWQADGSEKGKNKKGFSRSDFHDAWTRYLSTEREVREEREGVDNKDKKSGPSSGPSQPSGPSGPSASSAHRSCPACGDVDEGCPSCVGLAAWNAGVRKER